MSNPTILKSCAPPACGCPELELDDDACSVIITDDYNGVCCVSYAEFESLAKQFFEHIGK